MKIGGLFEGYGGLTMAAQLALGDGDLAWHSEIEPGPCKILARHWPAVPNLGDITAIDWHSVEPVDVLTGGSPCQDVSAAGKRAGMRAGTRSGLWESMREGIAILRPRLVIWENVRGATSACAHSDLADCPRCVGSSDRGHEPVLRALGRVLGDLADLGFDAEWHGLRAADVGAPHGRFRIFVVACDTNSMAWATGRPLGRRPSTVDEPRTIKRAVRPDRPLPAANTHDYTTRAGCEPGRSAGCRPEPVSGRRAATDADRDGCGRVTQLDSHQTTRLDSEHRRHPDGRDDRTDWGTYTSAIRRWETILGRPAPRPTQPGHRGGERLNPKFVEWMMGLPVGHVTDPAIGLTRNEMLKALGNGVVPQQGAAAIRVCLARFAASEVAA